MCLVIVNGIYKCVMGMYEPLLLNEFFLMHNLWIALLFMASTIMNWTSIYYYWIEFIPYPQVRGFVKGMYEPMQAPVEY